MSYNSITLSPNKLLLGKYFTEVKNEIKSFNKETDDLGTFICINYPDYFMVLNDMYELEIYYSKQSINVNDNVNNIEKIINEKIKNFSFDKSNIKMLN